MTRLPRASFPALLLPLLLSAGCASPGAASVPSPAPTAAAAPAAAPAPAPSPAAALAHLMRSLRANDGAVRAGMPIEEADRALPGAANHFGQRTVPLAGSWLDPRGLLLGTLDFDEDLETETVVDCVRVVLLAGPFDREELARVILSVGKEIGLDMEPGDDFPSTWFDYEATGVELWVTLGDGVIVLEAELAAGEKAD